MQRAVARLTDNQGKLLVGMKETWDFLTPPLNSFSAAADEPGLPAFGEKETVRWLECSYGSLGYLNFSSGSPEEQANDASPGSRPYDCHNQVDKPHKHHYCPSCGGFYCATHAEALAHDCNSVFRKR